MDVASGSTSARPPKIRFGGASATTVCGAVPPGRLAQLGPGGTGARSR